MTKANNKKPNKLAWLEAGFQLLAAGGIDSVRIDRISKKIGLTRGSFYWHFKSRDEFLDAMLELWLQRGTKDVIDLVEQAERTPEQQLIRLFELATRKPDEKHGGKFVELAIRIWGSDSPKVAKIIKSIDDMRVAFIDELLIRMLIDADRAKVLSEIIYNIYIGIMSRDLTPKQVADITNFATEYLKPMRKL